MSSKQLHNLLNPSSYNEETRRANIRDWLQTDINAKCEVEYPTKEGPVDIFLPCHKIIIETKSKGKAVPTKKGYGSHKDETPFEQLARYVEADRDSQGWIGIITDSEVWHIYEWTLTGPQELIDFKGGRSFKRGTLDGDSTTLDKLIKLFQQRGGTSGALIEPPKTFREILDRLTEHYNTTRKQERDVLTQQALWQRQLKIAGNEPPTNRQNNLFVLHSLLTITSIRFASTKLDDLSLIRAGFASWAKLDWLNKDIDKALTEIRKTQTGDILRTIYMDLVPKEDRHTYGEYYTPDWLAEKICLDIIDDEFIQEDLINKFLSKEDLPKILDPACGSGTFLLQAARRILNSKPIKDASLTDRQITDILTETLAGIDIHPVAVSMCTATLLQVMPAEPSTSLHIYQGDSLQLDHKDEIQQKINELEGDIFSIYSRRKRLIRFPKEWVMQTDFNSNMDRFAKAAVKGKKMMPAGVDSLLEPERKKLLHTALDTLTKVCLQEGNDIWAWYVIQHVGIFKLRGKVGRIVANPPWVRMSTIQDEKRKATIITQAKKSKVWVGDKNPSGFNLASLFVTYCKKLYHLQKFKIKSGWVLPDASLGGGGANWSKFQYGNQQYNYGNLVFPTASKCVVHYFGVETKPAVTISLLDNTMSPTEHEAWDGMVNRFKTTKIKTYTPSKSEWFEGKKTITKSGAGIFPHCLVLLESTKIYQNKVFGQTKRGGFGVWKGMSFEVNNVPLTWLKKVLNNKNGLYPYRIGTPSDAVIPIDDMGNMLEDRNDVKWWRDASDRYAAHAGAGVTTPKTLGDRLNYNGKLAKQFPFVKNMVLYNQSGASLYAARLLEPMIISEGLYMIKTSGESEAHFLATILNAEYLAERFIATRRSDRHFNTYFWHEVPIPRYKTDNPLHVQLAFLGKRAEKIAAGVEKPSVKKIRAALVEDGVSLEIDNIVKEIIIRT